MSAITLQPVSTPATNSHWENVSQTGNSLFRRRLKKDFRLRRCLRFSSISLNSDNGSASSSEAFGSSHFSSAVGTSSMIHLPHRSLTQRHVHILTFVACASAVSATWLFFSAIPTLLAFKRAAESLEKLLDVTREELPATMAAVRLSGMEISDLTMELSDLGQGITQGVRNSTRAVRLAEEKLRHLTNMAPPGVKPKGNHDSRSSSGQ